MPTDEQAPRKRKKKKKGRKEYKEVNVQHHPSTLYF